MKKLFENWRKHINEATNISAKFSDVDLSQMSSRDLYRLDGDVAAALGGLGIDITDPDADFKSTPEVDELMKQRRDIKIAIRDSERASGARIKGHLEEAEYEPGRAVADIDTGEDYVEPEMIEKEAMEDLADKFNVQVTFAKTVDGADIAVVTLQNGETMGYMDEEEMYQDLASQQEMSEGAVPHSAHHVVKKMKKTGLSAKEALKSLTTDLSDEEAERWLKRHKDEMDSAEQELNKKQEAK